MGNKADDPDELLAFVEDCEASSLHLGQKWCLRCEDRPVKRFLCKDCMRYLNLRKKPKPPATPGE